MIQGGDEVQLIEADAEQSRTETLLDRRNYFEECEVSWEHPVAEGTEVQATPEKFTARSHETATWSNSISCYCLGLETVMRWWMMMRLWLWLLSVLLTGDTCTYIPICSEYCKYLLSHHTVSTLHALFREP